MKPGSVWDLESSEEKSANKELCSITDHALKGNRKSQNYLRKLWDNESWKSIKDKLQAEGSAWYLWWMDGVRSHIWVQNRIQK